METITRLLWRLLCGCGHDRTGFPQKDRGVDYQRCLVCGARRRYSIGDVGEPLSFGAWERPELPVVAVVLGQESKTRRTAPAA